MKKTLFLSILLACYFLSYSQDKHPKTIFEVFNVSSAPCEMTATQPLSNPGKPIVDYKNDEAEEFDRSAKNELSNARHTIGLHFANLRTQADRTVSVYEFKIDGKLAGHIEKKGNEYTLYGKDNQVIWKKNFIHIEKDWYNPKGFNAFATPNASTYYDYTGKVISNGQYEYVEYCNNNYFRVLKDGKWGLINRKGELVVPVRYDYISQFEFKNRSYYVISEENIGDYYLADDLKTKHLIYHYQSAPVIFQNKYWIVMGIVYDPSTQKRLFCNIPNISAIPHTDLLHTYLWGTGTYHFDIEGNIINDSSWMSLTHVKKDIFHVALHDISLKQKTNENSKKALVRITGTKIDWITKPEFRRFTWYNDQDLIWYSSNSELTRPGLMDETGKIIIPEDTYNQIHPTLKKGWLLIDKDSSSVLFNPVTLKETPLKLNFKTIYRLTRDSTHAGGIAGDKGYLLDQDYNPINLPEFSILLKYDLESDLIKAPLYGHLYGRNIYFDRNLNKIQVTINDTTFDSFYDLKKLENGKYFIHLTYNRAFLQLSNNKFLPTPYEVISYDSVANWYIARRDHDLIGTIDSTGKVILPFAFLNVYPFENSSYIRLRMWFDEQLINLNGEVVHDLKYSHVLPIPNDNYIVTYNEKKGIVNSKGKIIMPLEYQYIGFRQGKIYARKGIHDPVQTFDLQLLLDNL